MQTASGWLILHGGALGDLALTLQLALRLVYTDANACLEVISRSDPGDLSACRPPIRRRSPEGLGLHWLFAEGTRPPAALLETIRGRRVLSAMAGPESAVHRKLLELAPACVFSFDPRPRPELARHITQQWQADLEAQGLLFPKCIHHGQRYRCLWVPPEIRARGRDMLSGIGVGPPRASRSDTPCVLIHPGSGGRNKNWPLPNFLLLADELRRSGCDTCFLVGPAELEWWSDSDLAAIKSWFPLFESPGPNELTALLAAADVLVANDCGPAQLAALLGTPTVVIFGPTSDAVWRPLGPAVRVIRGDPRGDPSSWQIDPRELAALVSALRRPAPQESSARTAR